MILLFIGDVYGKPGRRALRERLPALKVKHRVDATIANGENAADGFGIQPPHVDELCAAGVDLVTTGDHVWDKRELLPALEVETRVLRPANYPEGVPGRGAAVFTAANGLKVGVLGVQGRVFMFKQTLDDPFRCARREVARLKAETPIVLVDVHAEATSEKVALGWYLDGEASAVIGTHTHVQTADERILPGGTAYLTDAGMTGPAESVIGLDKEKIVKRFLTQMPAHGPAPAGRVQLCGAVVEVDDKTGKAERIVRIFETFELAGGEPPAGGLA